MGFRCPISLPDRKTRPRAPRMLSWRTFGLINPRIVIPIQPRREFQDTTEEGQGRKILSSLINHGSTLEILPLLQGEAQSALLHSSTETTMARKVLSDSTISEEAPLIYRISPMQKSLTHPARTCHVDLSMPMSLRGSSSAGRGFDAMFHVPQSIVRFSLHNSGEPNAGIIIYLDRTEPNGIALSF